MAGTELTFDDESLHSTRQLEQPDRVRNRRARPTDPRRDLLLGEVEVLDELLVRRRLLECVEILAMKVLDNRGFERSKIIGISNDRRNRRQIGPTSRSPPPLPCNEFIPSSVARTTIGWITPTSAIEAANDDKVSSSK